MNTVELKRREKKISGAVSLPGSKSISNRALIMAELAGSKTRIHDLSEADDTVMLQKHLNFLRTCGSSGIPTIFDVENAGTVARFLTAFLVSHEGQWLVTGCKRMRERPIGSLVDGLVALGAKIRYTRETGFLPIHITGREIHGGTITIDTSVSSQFVSAILMIGPYLEEGLKIKLHGDTVSKPYIAMTIAMMEEFGAKITVEDNLISVEPLLYREVSYQVEADWTSAAYWYEAAALSEKADIFIPGLKRDSIQGDRVLPEIYTHFGVNTKFEADGIRITSSSRKSSGFSYNFSSCPDLALSVITTCAALKTPCEFTGVKTLKFKESDRLKSLADELVKMGALLHSKDDWCALDFSKKIKAEANPVFYSHHDHRLAMSLAPLVLLHPQLQIVDAHVVAKSYPGFWSDLQGLNFAHVTETESE